MTKPRGGWRIAAAALAASSLFFGARAGMLGDRIDPAAGITGFWDLVAFPAAAAAAAAALAASLRLPAPPPRKAGRSWLFAAFGLWTLLSLFRSHYLYASFLALAILLAALLLAAAMRRAAEEKLWAYALILAQMTAASLVAGIGLSEYLLHLVGEGNSRWRVFATFADPNFLAGYMVMAVPVSASALLSARERPVTLLSGLALLLQIACLLLTGSRFALLALALSVAAFALFCRRSGALVDVAGRRARLLVVLGLGATIISAGPVLKRLLASGAESYSNQFRLLTWRGTLRMAASNPLLGTGLGTFDTSYAPYAEVAYTQHAHNSYLQLAAETGLPGALLFLAGVSVLFSSAFASLARPGEEGSAAKALGEHERPPASATRRRQRAARPHPTASQEPAQGAHPSPDSRILLAGLLASVTGALARNLVDSDLYVPANTLAFSAVCALTAALSVGARESPARYAGGSPPQSRPSRRWARVALGSLAGLLLFHAGRTALGRLHAQAGAEAHASARLESSRAADPRSAYQEHGATALAAYRRAVSVDAGNPEYHMDLADTHVWMGDPASAEEEYRAAIAAAPIAKAAYRYGRLLMRLGRGDEALEQLERARAADPHNLQGLLALAEARLAVGKRERADAIYREMVRMHRGLFGQVQAMPELVDWEYGVAYAGLAESASQSGDGAAATTDYLRQGAAILTQFWDRRNLELVRIRYRDRPDVFDTVSSRLGSALELLSRRLRESGRAEEAVLVDSRRDMLRRERAEQVRRIR